MVLFLCPLGFQKLNAYPVQELFSGDKDIGGNYLEGTVNSWGGYYNTVKYVNDMLSIQTQFIYISFFQLLEELFLGTSVTWNNFSFLKLGYV